MPVDEAIGLRVSWQKSGWLSRLHGGSCRRVALSTVGPFHVLGHRLGGALLLGRKPRSACLGLLHLLHQCLPTRPRVLSARSRSSIALNVLTLTAIGVVDS